MEDSAFLFIEHEEYRQQHAHKGCEVIPVERFILEGKCCIYNKDCKSYYLLNYLQLEKTVRATIALKTYSVGWYLETIFEERQAPRNQYNNI